MSTGNGLDDWLSKYHDEDQPVKIEPRYVRDEKGRFLGNSAAPFGVPKTVEVGKAMAMPKPKKPTMPSFKSIGTNAGKKVQNAGVNMSIKGSARVIGSKVQGQQPKLMDEMRSAFGGKIAGAGRAMQRNPEKTGFGIAAGGTAAGTGVLAGVRQNRQTRQQNRQKRF
jgi:hypothetical protein